MVQRRLRRLAQLALLLALGSPPAAAQVPDEIQDPVPAPPAAPWPALHPPEWTSQPAVASRRARPTLQPLYSVELGPSFPLARSAAMLGPGFLLGGHVGFQSRATTIFSIGPEARLSYSRWGNSEGYLGYPAGGGTGLLLATVGVRGIFHVGRVDLWGGARVGYAQVWRSVEGFPRLGEVAYGVAYDLEAGIAFVVQSWIGLGLTLGAAEPGVGANVGRADFKLVGLSLTGTLFFRPRSRS